MKIGVYGGTFDPIHEGHLAVARAAREAHGLDRVLVVPAGQPPHKGRELAGGDDRLAMARLACKDDPSLEVADLEVRRCGKSYTVETLERLSRAYPAAELFFIIGADSLPDLPGWKDLPRILDLARIITVNRPGYPLDFRDRDFEGVAEETLARLAGDRVDMEPSPVSSTRVREAVRKGESLESLVPPAVERYILEHGLYR